MRIAVAAERVTKAFGAGKGRSQILHDMSLQIASGELTLISGPSGCGKSTLLSILSGLQHPDAGKVYALGEELTRQDARTLGEFRLRHTGFVFQGFNLFPALTALEQVMLPLGYMGIGKDQILARSTAALQEVGLARHMRLRPAELSGGEKQRVAIARALAKQPQLLFADEPTSALDAANGQIVIDLLHQIAQRHGTTVLCVSHDARVTTYADRVLTMEDGRILSDVRQSATAADATRSES